MSASRWPRWRWIVVGALALGLPPNSACQGTAGPEIPGPAPGRPPALGVGSRVLLLGNSLTAGNDLAAMLQAVAASAGLGWDVRARVVGGASLEDHWHRAGTVDLIRNGGWDAVVLQQGPSSLPESRASLRHWAAVFDGEIRAAGARTSLYMVWPEQDRAAAFDRVRDSYALAAADVGGHFLPAGETWRAAWRRDRKAELYGSDGFHPTPAGSYAAALTIYAGLAGRSPVGRPATLLAPGGSTLVSVPPPLAGLLQAAAAEATAAYRDYRPPDRP